MYVTPSTSDVVSRRIRQAMIFRSGGTMKVVAGIALILVATLANALGATSPEGRVIACLITAACMIGLIALIGSGMNGRPAGVLIDSRNRVSLSKLQATSWTIVVLSGLATIFAAKLQ